VRFFANPVAQKNVHVTHGPVAHSGVSPLIGRIDATTNSSNDTVPGAVRRPHRSAIMAGTRRWRRRRHTVLAPTEIQSTSAITSTWRTDDYLSEPDLAACELDVDRPAAEDDARQTTHGPTHRRRRRMHAASQRSGATETAGLEKKERE